MGALDKVAVGSVARVAIARIAKLYAIEKRAMKAVVIGRRIICLLVVIRALNMLPPSID